MLEDLNRLRSLVGQPSLSQLQAQAELEGHAISRAALWDLLNGRGQSRWSTVVAFVAACWALARRHRPPILLGPEYAELTTWQQLFEARRGRPFSPAPIILPRQLPAAASGLAGRQADIDELDALRKDAGSGPAGMSPILVITGTAGVGKTTLALWWAQKSADEFPDGQLYFNLRGFGNGIEPATPQEVLRAFLDAFDVPPQRIPAELPGQSALFRSVLTGRRVLIVLDNARHANQVRPLLPGRSGCVVIVTTRLDPVSLVAMEGARLHNLDRLSDCEARQLMRDRLGDARVTAEPTAVNEIINRCAHLPLALVVVAARAASSAATLTSIAEGLRSGGSLDLLAVGDDPHTDVRTAFSWSYLALASEVAEMFRLLGLHPGPDLDRSAAASLVRVGAERASTLLDELAHAHLIEKHADGRYELHDLLREYAKEQADSAGDHLSRAAILRLVNHYLGLAQAADRLLDPLRDARTRLVEPEDSELTLFESAARAHHWLRTEHRVLIHTVDLALRSGLDAHAWQLAWSLSTYLDRDGHWHDWATTMTAAIQAAEHLAHPAAEAIAHRILAHALVQQNQLDAATDHLNRALRLFHDVGDAVSEAATHNSIGGVCDLEGRPEDALDHALIGLGLFEAANDAIGRAHAFNSVGWCQAKLGRYDLALAACERSRSLLQELGDQHGEATAWDSIGFIHHQLGDHRRAIACFEKALVLFCATADRFYRAEVLDHLGDCQRDLGDLAAARKMWRQALATFDNLTHPAADRVRDKLVDSDEP